MKRAVKLISVFTMLFITVVSICGCSKYNSNAVIYYETDEVPSTVDPQLASSETELMIVRNIFEGLMRLDENGDVVNGVAESYTYEDLTYTFNISQTAQWNDGTELTAYDFEFAFKRAVDPAVKAPFASKLSSILNAELILSGNISAENLAVKAVNSSTLTITMAREDSNFLYKLTTSVFMPCQKDFFEECNGEYGLSKSTILTNGSYKLSKWNKEDFALRLHRNEKYYGNFAAKNSAVFISNNQDKSNLELLENSSIDIAYIEPSEMNTAASNGLKTVHTDNIVWVMRFSNSLSYDTRRAFITGIDRSLYAGNLGIGYNAAYTFFPSSLYGEDLKNVGMPEYDINSAKALFQTSLKNYSGKKLGTTTIIYYNDSSFSRPVSDIVGHWQNHLGAYINIQPSDSISEITSKLYSSSNYIAVYPIYITDKDPTIFLNQLGYSYTENEIRSLSAVQSNILSDYKVIPLAFQNSVIAYSSDITNFYSSVGNGTFDFSFVTKK